jgi:hypothetical protein
MHGSRDNIDAGGMVSHGPDTTDLFRRAARVCRQNLARGEPGDLPVEQPTKFKLIINLKAAKALGRRGDRTGMLCGARARSRFRRAIRRLVAAGGLPQSSLL